MPVSHARARLWLLALITILALPAAHAELVLSAAPRESKDKEEALYNPIADLLTKAIGSKVTFRYADNYLIYQSEMRKGTYDIAFDGPAFVGWRINKLNHAPLVKFPGSLVFVVIAKKDQDKIHDLKTLAGRTICSFPPPNLAPLVVMYEFDNPARQPLIIETQSFQGAYKGVLSGQCTAGIMQAKLFQDMDKDAKAAKVIYTSRPLPNQAFSVGPRVTPEMREKMVKALLSPEGVAATQRLRDTFKVPALLPTTVDEYKDLGKLLRDTYGFES